MKWRREIDYHGSRSYGADPSDRRRFSEFVEWLAKLGRAKPSDRRSRALPGTQQDFSLFGARRAAPARRAADCPFPLKPDNFEARDWRLLP